MSWTTSTARTSGCANAIAALPEDLVTRPDAFAWTGGEALADAQLFSHLHDEHEPALRAWLDGHA